MTVTLEDSRVLQEGQAELTSALMDDLDNLGVWKAAAGGALGTAWRSSTFGDVIEFDPRVASEALNDVLPSLLLRQAVGAAGLAADWYDMLRFAAAIPLRYYAVPAAVTVGTIGAGALIGWAVHESPSLQTLYSNVKGGTQLRIANAARDTIAKASIEDPKGTGWQRVANASACGFCRMLESRGHVYLTESTADFGAHDDCNCSAAPAWEDQEYPVRPYTPSERDIPQDDRDRATLWMRNHGLI